MYLALAGFFGYKLATAYKKFSININYSDRGMLEDLPSVSVCIPARNETHAMTQCLERVVASNYPKIEIIVLDDSSVDDTSVLIKSFAHSGVRFVEGSPLPENWLGKNHALSGLLREASGRYILFMDVDTQIAPDTISQLVAYARSEKALMVSVLPRHGGDWRISVLWSTLRYYWELILHSSKRPAASSSAWLIHRHTLRDEIGGFEKFRLSVQPESLIAAELSRNHQYRFLIGTRQLGISYEKRWLSQIETSVRLLLPKVGGLIPLAIAAVICLALLSMPSIVFVASLIYGWWQPAWGALLVNAVFGGLYASFAYKTWSHGWITSVILWPLLVFQEMALMIISIIRYSTGRITWKGRPVVAAHKIHKLH